MKSDSIKFCGTNTLIHNSIIVLDAKSGVLISDDGFWNARFDHSSLEFRLLWSLKL